MSSERSYRILADRGAGLTYESYLAEWNATFEIFVRRADESLVEFSMDDLCMYFLKANLQDHPGPELVEEFRDTYLDEWSMVDGNPSLAAYARYRIFAIAVALEDRPAADAVFSELDAMYPVGNSLHDFVEMAILFRNAYGSGGLGSACTGAGGFAESHADVVLEPLGSQNYGYANRDYSGASMCPAPMLDE